MMKRWGALMIVLVGLTVGCAKTELYHNLSEEDVNEILVVLNENGVTAYKKKEMNQNEVSWMLEVDPSQVAKARSLLREHNLPRRHEAGLSEVYKEKGLIPTPDEQKARYHLAVKGEIINALRKNPDVVDADTILNIPDKVEYGSDPSQAKRPTASLIIKIRPTPEAQATLTEVKLQRFVANAVPDMDPRDVTVLISYVGGNPTGQFPGQTVILPTMPNKSAASLDKASTTINVAGVEVTSTSSNRLKIYLGIFLGLLVILSIALIIMVIHTSRVRQEARTPSATVDGQLMSGDDPRRLGPG